MIVVDDIGKTVILQHKKLTKTHTKKIQNKYQLIMTVTTLLESEEWKGIRALGYKLIRASYAVFDSPFAPCRLLI